MKKNFKIDVLGTEYSTLITWDRTDPMLVNNDGYCDLFDKRIVVADIDDGSIDMTKNPREGTKKITRHEIIHAFLFESGLNNYCQDEILVEYLAIQIKKIMD